LLKKDGKKEGNSRRVYQHGRKKGGSSGSGRGVTKRNQERKKIPK